MRSFTVRELLTATKTKLLNKNDVDLDIKINKIVIDSREAKPESLFVTIVGSKSDAHNYLPQVYEAGCRVCIVSREDIELIEGMVYLKADNAVTVAQELAKYYRDEIRIPIVGITGSVGKTTTREIVAAALSAQKKVFKTPANFNSQIGVPITVLDITNDYDIAVLELGMSEFGEMNKIAQIARPDVGIITNVGTAHIENLKSRENIRDEKLHIQDGMKKGSFILLNAQDEMLVDTKCSPDINVNYYGIEDEIKIKNLEHEKLSYAKNIKLSNGLANFEAFIMGERVEVSLGVHGKHQVLNALTALWTVKHFGVDLKPAAKSISEFKGFKHRQQIFIKNNITIIDDTYNASPDSMKAAINILKEIDSSKRKIAVLGDMKELGEFENELHYEIGEYLANLDDIDYLICFGELSKNYARAWKMKSKEKCFIFQNDEREKLLTFINDLLKAEDIVLFKGSNSMKLWEIIEGITRCWRQDESF